MLYVNALAFVSRLQRSGVLLQNIIDVSGGGGGGLGGKDEKMHN